MSGKTSDERLDIEGAGSLLISIFSGSVVMGLSGCSQSDCRDKGKVHSLTQVYDRTMRSGALQARTLAVDDQGHRNTNWQTSSSS
jgi:hypothetical protein